MRRVPPYRWLALVPGLLILVGVPFANRVHGQVLGVPFLLAWILAAVVLTSPIMALIGALDAKRAARGPAPGPPTATPAAAPAGTRPARR